MTSTWFPPMGLGLPLCEQYAAGATLLGTILGRYHAAVPVTDLPEAVGRDDCAIEHGYAVSADRWYFLRHLPPALALGRAVRMSLECRSYGVFAAACETRYCHLGHGDELLLHVVSDSRLDRRDDEVADLERWVRGIRRESAHWHPPTADALTPAEAPTGESRRCALYLQFDSDNVLLYVGISDDPATRGRQHASRSTWVQFAHHGEIVWCASRAEAEQREADLIRERLPLFNDQHAAPGRDERLVAYLVGKSRLDLLAPAITRG